MTDRQFESPESMIQFKNIHMYLRPITLLALILFFTEQPALAQSQLDFLSDLAEARNLRQMLPNHVNGLARAALAARSGKIAELTTPAAFQARKRMCASAFWRPLAACRRELR
jgi:hypothetical protein